MTGRCGLTTVPFVLALFVAACAGGTAGAPGLSVAEPAEAPVATTVWESVYTARQASLGAAEYDEHCSSCHSADLRGNSNTPSLIGASFRFLWENRSLEELFTTIRTQMPTNAPNSLPTQSYVVVLAFILEANGFPAGERELTGDPEVLGRIQISAGPGA